MEVAVLDVRAARFWRFWRREQSRTSRTVRMWRFWTCGPPECGGSGRKWRFWTEVAVLDGSNGSRRLWRFWAEVAVPDGSGGPGRKWRSWAAPEPSGAAQAMCAYPQRRSHGRQRLLRGRTTDAKLARALAATISKLPRVRVTTGSMSFRAHYPSHASYGIFPRDPDAKNFLNRRRCKGSRAPRAVSFRPQ